MTTLATKGITIGGGSKKKSTTVAATLPPDFYRKYEPPRAPQIKPQSDMSASLKMEELALPGQSVGDTDSLSADMDTPMHSMSLRQDGLSIAKTMPSRTMAVSTKKRDVDDTDSDMSAEVAKMTVGSLTAMDVLKSTPGAKASTVLKTYKYGGDSRATTVTTAKGTKGATKGKGKLQYAMEEDSDDEDSDHSEESD